MTLPNRTRGTLLLLGTSVLLMLGLFAWHYFLERTACFDSAFFSWLMIDTGEPISVLGRYGSWIPQLLPVALLKFNAPLEAVLRSYSIAFILFHGLIFYLLHFRLKDAPSTLALPLTLTATFHYMFYYGISELYQGLSLSLLLWALLRRAWTENASLGWSVLVVVVNTIISVYHQLLILPLVFLLVHEAIENQKWKKMRIWILSIVLVLWYVLRITLMTGSTYEEARMPKMGDLLTYAFQLKNLNSTVYLIMVWTKFKALLLIMLATVVLSAICQAWARLIWAILFSTGSIVLFLIVDRDGMAPIIYENYYPVVGFVWCVLFTTVAHRKSGKTIPVALGIAIIASALGLLQIHRGHYRFTARIQYAERITTYQARHGIYKSLVHFDNFPWSYALVHWAVGFESALISAVKGPDKAATIFVSAQREMLDSISDRNDIFLGPDWHPIWFGLHNLDHRYFNFPTNVGYVWANTADAIPQQLSINIQAPSSPYRMVPDRFTVVPIQLCYNGEGYMPSCGSDGRPIQFVYEIFQSSGAPYQKSAIRSSLEVDLLPGTEYTQGLVVERPVDNGAYTVFAWMEYDGSVVGPKVRFDVVADSWPL